MFSRFAEGMPASPGDKVQEVSLTKKYSVRNQVAVQYCNIIGHGQLALTFCIKHYCCDFLSLNNFC